MKDNRITLYLHDLERQLRRSGAFDVETMEELEGHLRDTVEEGFADRFASAARARHMERG